jgi:hypothetical protein
MKNKIQKSTKIKKKPEFYVLKEVLNLIGKKTCGGDFLFERHLGIIREKHGYYVKTLEIADLLIRNLFFETKKDDGKVFKQGEDLFLIKDGKTVSNFKIPKEQFDYVLETGKRFCDKKQSDQPNLITQVY